MTLFCADFKSVHLCVDMQRLFADPTDWHTPALTEILPQVRAIVAAAPARTVFTRFRPPTGAAAAPGAWAGYYAHWNTMTEDRLVPGAIGLVPSLREFVPPAEMVDKPGYGAFAVGTLEPVLDRIGAGSLIVTGVETDVCVLATVLQAVDRGIPVIVVEDAVASASPQGHAAAMAILSERFPEQVAVTTTNALLAQWPGSGGRPS